MNKNWSGITNIVYEGFKEPKEYEFIPKSKYPNYETQKNIEKSDFENKLYEDTLAEISRLEEELNFLRQFLKLVGWSSPKQNSQSISKPAKKSPQAKSAPKKAKPKRTKAGKKIGRPTNAEKFKKELKEINKIENEIEKGINKLVSEGKI